MEAVFLKVVNLGLSAGWLVLAVLVLRLVLRRAPRWMLCALWGLVALRLICPVSIESALSLVPSDQTLPAEILTAAAPEIRSGVTAIDRVVNPVLTQTMAPAPGASANPTQILSTVLTWVWVAGVAAMLLYALVSTLLLRRRVATATRYAPGVKQSEYIAMPFVLGVLRPTIYLPYQMEEADLPHVLAHERAHIRRRDGAWKLLGFLLLSVYWFHPLLWVAYLLFCRDIESACDEAVIRDLPEAERRAYAAALLRCSTGHAARFANPLSFSDLKYRP